MKCKECDYSDPVISEMIARLNIDNSDNLIKAAAFVAAEEALEFNSDNEDDSDTCEDENDTDDDSETGELQDNNHWSE